MSQQFNLYSRFFQFSQDNPQFVRIAGSVFTFATTLTLFVYYVRLPAFIDEIDNMWGGIQIAAGRVPYLDFYSQHTPLAYYLSASGFVLGAETIFLQRAFFYVFVSICLATLYYRNFRVFGALPLLFTAIFYVTSHAANPDLAYTFLSDQIQAVAYLFIFFEFLAVLIGKRNDYSLWIVVALASFAAVGVAFIAVYFVAFAIIFIWIFWYWNFTKAKKIKPISISGFFRGLIFPAGIVIIPFLLFTLYLAAVGALGDFIQQAYLLNRDVYSKYMGGFGQDALAPIAGPYLGFSSHISGLLGSFSTHYLSSTRDLLNIISIFILAMILTARRWFIGVAFLVVMAYTQMRGWHGFHAQPFWAISSAAIAILIWSKELGLFRIKFNRYIQIVAAVLVTIFMVLPYVRKINDPLPPNGLSFSRLQQTTKEKIITTLVPPDGVYLDTSLDIGNVVSTGRLPAGGVPGMVPWFTDVFEAEFIERIEKTKPVIIFHDPNGEVWGHILGEFAPLLNDYIRDNYSPVTMSEGDFGSGLWIRNSELNSAKTKLESAFPLFKFQKALSVESQNESPIGVLDSSHPVKEIFMSEVSNLAGIQVKAGTYARSNLCDLDVEIRSSSGQEIARKKFACKDLIDNFSITIDFPVIKDSEGQQFALTVTSTTPSGKDGVTLWRTQSKVLKGSSLLFGNENIEADLVMNLLVPRTFAK